MDTDPIDLKYAKQVADYLGTDHTEVIMTKEDLLENLRDVIFHLETYDITTIRASMAMYLLCKYIHEKTDLKVILTGEVSDELFGYKYTLYTDEDVIKAKEKYAFATPFTKESLLYRDIFESFYPGQAKWVKDFWMPNKDWENCNVDDPSARVLKNYGDSGK